MNFHTIHKRKIASEQILFYICENKYTSWAKLFAHMTIISGKPVLYGYNYSGSIKAVDLTIIKSKDILDSTSSLIDSYVDSQYKQIQFIISCESKEDCEYYIENGKFEDDNVHAPVNDNFQNDSSHRRRSSRRSEENTHDELERRYSTRRNRDSSRSRRREF